MTNHKEEQELELEALTSIFEEGKELEKLSDTEFLLKFKPFPQDEEENHVGVTLRIAYTDEYPDTAPDWEVQDVVGLGDPKLDELKGKIGEAINESLGMAMVYTVAEMCQDWLKENNVKELSMHEQMMKRLGGDEEEQDDEEGESGDEVDIADQLEQEWKGLKEKPLCAANERLTVDTFLEWKKRFDDEMIANGTLKRDDQKAKTGKQLFLDAQDTAEAQAKADGKEGAAKDSAALAYNAALFGEADDDDLDDLSDGEDESPKASGYPG